MIGEKELAVHTVRSTKPLEWVGLTIVKAWLSAMGTELRVGDVHNDPAWFHKGIDLVLTYPDHVESVDLKVDSYFGRDPRKKARGLYNLDTGVLLIETTSQLRYDRTDLVAHPDVPGWFFTSEADRILYYCLAIESSPADVRAVYNKLRALEKLSTATDLVDRELLASVQIERDELFSYSLRALRDWFLTAPEEAFEGWAGAGNPSYVTVSRRLRRSYLLESGLGVSHGSIFHTARDHLSRAMR